MEKGRLEAFTDGVLAVAITLLVLDLHAEANAEESLGHQLAQEWPSFAAYILSFFIIGVIWVNHHALFSLVGEVDRLVMLYNLVLLAWVTTIPFTTATLAGYLRAGGSDVRLAVILYGVSMEGTAVSFTFVMSRLMKHDLLLRPVRPHERRRALLRFSIAVGVYPMIAAVGMVSPIAMIVLSLVLNGFYIAEQMPILQADKAALNHLVTETEEWGREHLEPHHSDSDAHDAGLSLVPAPLSARAAAAAGPGSGPMRVAESIAHDEFIPVRVQSRMLDASDSQHRVTARRWLTGFNSRSMETVAD